MPPPPEDSLSARALRRVGTVLCNRYRLTRLIGLGGMGAVYAGEHVRNGHLVAVKVLHERLAGDPEHQRLFRREGRLANQVKHPGAVPVLDDDEAEDGAAFLVLPLLSGETLRRRWERSGRALPLDEVVQITHAVLEILAAAHAAKIVHRDVKPENVFVTTAGEIRVLDFGIARVLEANESSTATQTGLSLGTPAFMAPEQARGRSREIDARTDLWAVGATMFTLLSGRMVHEGESSSDVLIHAGTKPARALREVAPGVPEAIAKVVDRALAFEKDARWGDAAAMDRGLRDAYVEATGRSLETVGTKLVVPEEEPGGGGAGSTEVLGGDAREVNAPGAGSTRTAAPPVSRPAGARVPASAEVAGRSVAPRRVARWVAGAAVVVAVGAVGLFAWRGRTRAATLGQAGVQRGGGAEAAAGACTSNKECVEGHGGAAWHCHSGRHVCVEIASPDCKVYAGAHDAEAEDVVWFGGMFPLSEWPKDAEMRATELAREDFAQALGPSVARSGALHARPIGLVVCDEGKGVGDALRVAHHLADEVEVPAVIGFRSRLSALTTISTVFLQNRALAFVSISQAPELTKIPEPDGEPRLVWRSTLNREDMAAPLAHLISDVLEPAARAGPRGIGDRPLRVAAAWSKTGNHDVESEFRTLRFNGRSALENGSNFRQLTYERGTDAGDTIDQILAFTPQVIDYSDEGFAETILLPLEAAWDSGLRPVYLTPAGLGPAVIAFAGRNPMRRRRFFSVTNLPTTMTNAQLVIRYNLVFPDEPIVRSEAPQPSYDAFYVLAYATYALGDGAVSGPALSSAMKRLLPPGPRVDVGPGNIFEGFRALRSNGLTGRIDLNGAIGSLDFDPATGEAPIDYAIVCLGVDDHGAATAAVDSGLVYDARAKKLIGTLHCP